MHDMTRLRCGKPLHVQGLCLFPIERVCIEAHRESGHTWMHAQLGAQGIVICRDDHIQALDSEGQVLRIEDLLDEVDGLQSAIDACRKT